MSDRRCPVAILAGGKARRLRPLTEAIPKALVDVNGEPFIIHQLRLLRSNGIEHVVICTGYLGEMIEQAVGDGSRFGQQVAYSADGPKLLGTAGCIKKALPLLGEVFFVIYGDSYLPCDFGAVHAAFEASGKQALMTVFFNDGRYDTSNVEFVGGRIISYDKECPTQRMKHIDYGLGMFRRAAFDFVPQNTPCDLASVYAEMLRRNQLAGFEVSERFYEIGSAAGLEDTRRFLAATTTEGV